MEGFPHCEGKVTWMKDMWRSDSCYGNYGVDGSSCSYFIYLSEVENWCPRLPWRTKTLNEEIDRRGQAEVRTSFEELYRVMSAREEFRWMMLRIKRMADPWVSAIRSLASKQNLVPRRRKKVGIETPEKSRGVCSQSGEKGGHDLQGGVCNLEKYAFVLVHLGLLTKESGFKIAENAFSGGPLGELVQWSDLITTLYLLGHDVRISASLAELKEIMRKVMGNKSSCPTQGDKVVELIYIDIVGLTQFKKTLGPSWVHYQCMLRVLDSFGTEPEFNHAHYAQAKGHKTPWGKWNLNPQQFNTMFRPKRSLMFKVLESFLLTRTYPNPHFLYLLSASPCYSNVDSSSNRGNTLFFTRQLSKATKQLLRYTHTPDNSFLGFVVEQHLNASDIRHIDEVKRQNQSLVYGKVDNFWKVSVAGIISSVQICGMLRGDCACCRAELVDRSPLASVVMEDKKKYLDNIHSYMENHGILSGRDLQFLLRESK
ncbi:hypothetical protein JOQ06_000224, partial [Pogonophryne albipinna]